MQIKTAYKTPDAETIFSALNEANSNEPWMAERVFPAVARGLANSTLVREGIALKMHLSIYDAFKALDDLSNPVLNLLPILIGNWIEAVVNVSEEVYE